VGDNGGPSTGPQLVHGGTCTSWYRSEKRMLMTVEVGGQPELGAGVVVAGFVVVVCVVPLEVPVELVSVVCPWLPPKFCPFTVATRITRKTRAMNEELIWGREPPRSLCCGRSTPPIRSDSYSLRLLGNTIACNWVRFYKDLIRGWFGCQCRY
jgi:hypothetical protein